MPPAATPSGRPIRLCASANRIEPASSVAARCGPSPNRLAIFARCSDASRSIADSRLWPSRTPPPVSFRSALAVPPVPSPSSAIGGTMAGNAAPAPARPGPRPPAAGGALPAGRGDDDRAPLTAEPMGAPRLGPRDLRGLHALRRSDVAIALDLLAQAERLTLLAHGHDLLPGRPGDEQAERIGSDVDDRDPHPPHCVREGGQTIIVRAGRLRLAPARGLGA